VSGEAVRRLAGAAWSFRFVVEHDAEARFARLALRLAAAGFPAPLVALAERSSRDERRHAALCAEEARLRGAVPPAPSGDPPSEIAPAGLTPAQAALYEVVAACCVTETESTAVLTTLLALVSDPRLRTVLRSLARDEVRHARLGWACLAHAHGRGETAFLGLLVPGMLQGAAPPDLFLDGVAPERADPALLEHGVLPHDLKREIFVRTLEEVICPGLSALGVDDGPARGWLARRRGETARQRRVATQPGDAARR
jgi:hypothetical protein